MVVGEVEAVAAWLFLSQTFAQAQTPMEPGLQAHPMSLLGAVRGSGGPLGISDLLLCLAEPHWDGVGVGVWLLTRLLKPLSPRVVGHDKHPL